MAINPNQGSGVRVSRTNLSLIAGIYSVAFAVRPEKLPRPQETGFICQYSVFQRYEIMFSGRGGLAAFWGATAEISTSDEQRGLTAKWRKNAKT